MNIKLTAKSPYVNKDQAKANKATCFIGRGRKGSSTEAYQKDFGALANKGTYTDKDIVFVSVNGKHPNRVLFPVNEVNLAIAAKVTFITDKEYDRNREYNIGEREFVSYLKSNGYIETNPGVWNVSN